MTFTAEPNIGSHLSKRHHQTSWNTSTNTSNFSGNAKSPSQEASEEGTSRTRKAR